ncbi:hypothetical protein ABZ942_19145 [Nocardia sp. NPDC046473]
MRETRLDLDRIPSARRRCAPATSVGSQPFFEALTCEVQKN